MAGKLAAAHRMSMTPPDRDFSPNAHFGGESTKIHTPITALSQGPASHTPDKPILGYHQFYGEPSPPASASTSQPFRQMPPVQLPPVLMPPVLAARVSQSLQSGPILATQTPNIMIRVKVYILLSRYCVP